MANNEIKYDGSYAEMIRLGLIDETGCENNKRRNELNQYLSRVYQRAHPSYYSRQH